MMIKKIVIMKLVLVEDKADNCGYSIICFFALHSKVLESTSHSWDTMLLDTFKTIRKTSLKHTYLKQHIHTF